MLASIPASTLNQNPADWGIPNRFNSNESDSSSGTNVDLSRATRARLSVLDGRFLVTLDGNEMVAEPQVHYASAEDARAVLDRCLGNSGWSSGWPRFPLRHRRSAVMMQPSECTVV